VTFPSNTGIVTTTDNNFTLPVVSDSKPGNSSTETTEVVPTSPVPEKQETVHDFASLKRHIQRTVKYPTSAKENSVTGFTIANFNVRAKKIADVKILKSLNKDIDDEVIRTLGSYQDTLDVPDDIYAIAFVFKLVGSEGTAEQMPNISTKNFAGQIIVMAMGKQEAKSAKGLPVSQDESVNDFSRVDILPEFPGGIAGWADYLRTTLRYPKLARDNNIQGRVILSFVVNKDGSLSDIKVLRGIGGGADEEAVRVLTTSPAWKPGIVNGEAVKVAYTLPINFTLSQDISEEKPVEQKND
jgi:TonB family protein